MASIDERVVSIAFENSKFEANVAVTQATLAKLNASIANVGKVSGLENIEKAAQKVTLTAPMSALDKLRARLGLVGAGAAEGFGEIDRAGNKVALTNPIEAIDKVKGHLATVGAGAADGFTQIEKASGKVQLLGLHHALDSVTTKFSGMTVAFTAALGTLTSQATIKGKNLVSSLSLGPVTQGFEEYTTNLQSIQTILANTKASGADLKDVNDALSQLNTYSDQTIYNFSQMANAIGLFTAAGVDLDTSVASIKGIANLAALSGSNNEKATESMKQLSQAIASGKVGLQDWTSVVTAGMGGATFQRALATTAQNIGTLSDGAVKLKGKMKNVSIEGQSFRDSIMARPGEKSWLTSEVLTNTLQQFTGDLTDAELAAQGFSEAQIKSIQETAKTAREAATQVKDVKQLFQVAAESIGSGWSESFKLIFGNFTEAKKTFTSFSLAWGEVIGKSADARNEIIKQWKELGGRKVLIEGIRDAFSSLATILEPIKEAFRDIFPRKTGEDLYNLTVQFRDFMKNLAIGPETAENLKRSFRGLFAIVHIGVTIVKGLLGAIFDLLGVVGEGSGGFLAFTGSIGDFLVALDTAISKGKGLEGVFEGLSSVLRTPLELLKAIASAIGGLFGEQDPATAGDISDSFNAMAESAGPLASVLRALAKAWGVFFDVMEDIGQFILPILEDVKNVFSQIGDKVVEGLEGVDYDKVMTAIQTTFIGGLAVGIKKLLGGIGIDLTGGLVKNFKNVTDILTGTLTAIQKNINAQTLLLIAAAVLALAAATIIFSQIDARKLSKAMAAISVGIGQLVGAMFLLTKVSKGAGVLALPFIAASMLVLATAMIALGAAMKIMSTMSWEEIAKGLTGIAGGLAIIAAASKIMGPQILLIGPGLLITAAALNVLAVAMKIFGEMDWEEIGKGLIGIGGALVIIGAAIKGIGPGILIAGPGLILVSAGLILLSGAVSSFGAMKLETLGKGLLGIAASLIVIGAAILAIPPTIALQAAGLVILGIALTGIATAVGLMGSLGIGTIAKGLIAISAALLIFAVGLTAMAGTLPGSAALLAAAAAFAILTPALVILGNLKWSTILKGLGAIALTLGVLAVVGALASGPLTALGLALIVIGGAVLLGASGLYILAKAFALLGDEGTKGVSVMIAAITALIALIPSMVINFVKGIVQILDALVELSPKIANSLVKIIGTFLTAMVDLFPKAAVLIQELLALIVKIMDENAAPLIAAGFRTLVHFLTGIANNVGKVTEQVVRIIIGFLNAMVANAPRLAESGAKALGAWLRGIANNLGQVVAQAARVLVKFLEGIARNLPKVYAAGVKVITAYLDSVAKAIPKVVKSGVSIVLGVIEGIGNALPRLVKAAVDMIVKFVRAVGREAPRVADAGAKAAIDFLNGLADAIRDNDEELFKAMANVGDALIDGLIHGLEAGAGAVKDKLLEIAKGGVNSVLKFFGISSPSKLFREIGIFTMQGWVVGMNEGARDAIGASSASARGIVSAFDNVPPALRQIGREVGQGFAKGLDGSKADIRNAFSTLHSQISDAIKTARGNIATEQATLNELLKEKKPDLDAIKKSQQIIAQGEETLRVAIATRKTLVVSLRDEKKELLGLTNQYNNVSAKLEEARAALDSAVAARDNAKKSLTDKFSTTPTIDKDSKTAVFDYVKALREQIAATKSYSETLAKLRALGLDDTTYQKLLDEGLAGKEFAESLLQGGKTAVDGINSLDTELLAASTTLAQNAATSLYQAGVDAAQGLVNGLKTKKKDLEDLMDDLANSIVRAIKRKLKIKSPSEVFQQVGRFTAEGLAKGIRDSSKVVDGAAEDLGFVAMSAVQKSIAGMSAAISENIDVDPVITPVMDLSNIEKGAQKIGDLTNVTPITAAPSFQQAAAISEEHQATQDAQAAEAAVQQFHFEQNNYSPEKLSEIEIYRQTGNQLAQAKSVLGLAK